MTTAHLRAQQLTRDPDVTTARMSTARMFGLPQETVETIVRGE